MQAFTKGKGGLSPNTILCLLPSFIQEVNVIIWSVPRHFIFLVRSTFKFILFLPFPFFSLIVSNAVVHLPPAATFFLT